MVCLDDDLKFAQNMYEIAVKDGAPQQVLDDIIAHCQWLVQRIQELRYSMEA